MGYDGNSGQSQYKQKCIGDSTSTPITTDQSMFMFSLAPLELRCFPEIINNSRKSNNFHIIWQNPLPSSTIFC
jgi:hypothetical protein